MFEIGYALVADLLSGLCVTSFPEAERNWKQMRTLTTVRYASYTNSDDIRIAFLNDPVPIFDLALFLTSRSDQDYSGTTIPPSSISTVSMTQTPRGQLRDASMREQDRGMRLIESDPRESAFDSLAWYAQQIYDAEAVIVHFDDPARADARVHNSRLALVAGLAVEMRKPLLMLAEHQYLSPIDYRDLYLYVYSKPASSRVRVATDWLGRASSSTSGRQRRREDEHRDSAACAALEIVRLGSTTQKRADECATICRADGGVRGILANPPGFGPKRYWKERNAQEAAEELRADRRQLVCFIKPYAYELAAVTSLLEKSQERDQKGFVVESLWKFLLYTRDCFRDIPRD